MTFLTSFQRRRNPRGVLGSFYLPWVAVAAHFVECLCPWLSQPHARYALHKTAHKHCYQARKHIITRKNELEALCQGLQSTVHADKTGKHQALRKTASWAQSVAVLANANAVRVLPGVSSTKRWAKEHLLPRGCICLATTNIESLYLGNSSKLEAVSLPVATQNKPTGRYAAAEFSMMRVTATPLCWVSLQPLWVCLGAHIVFSAKSCFMNRYFHCE